MVDAASAWRRVILAAVVVVLGVAALPAGAAARASARSAQASSTNAQCPWVASSQPIAARVSELIGQMTVAQEVFLVEGHGTTNEGPNPSPNPYVFWMPGIPALCIPALGEEDGPAGSPTSSRA
jgi:beta-glucosidase